MLLGEMLRAARDLADDSAADELWKDPELTRYANEAVREAARRSRLIVDSETAHEAFPDGAPTDPSNPDYVRPPSVCEYPVLLGNKSITLHPTILFVRVVNVASKPIAVPKIHLADLNHLAPGWENADANDIIAYCANKQPRKLFFYSGFPANDTVNLQVVRMPLVDMADQEADSPEIDALYHDSLIHWMLYKMFLKPDEDTKDVAKAKDHLEIFEGEFGQRSSAIDETWIQREHGYDENEGLF